MRGERCVDDGGELGVEGGARESQRAGAARVGRDRRGVEAFNGGADLVGLGAVEEGSGPGVVDGVEGAAGASRDDGAAAGLGFDGDDAEIFGLGHDQGVCGPEVVSEVGVAARAAPADEVGGGVSAFEGSGGGAVADDVDGGADQAGGFDGEVEAFVWLDRAGDEERACAGCVVGCEVVCADGGVDDDAVAVVDGADARGDVGGVGDELCDIAGAGVVPCAEAWSEAGQAQGAGAVGEGGAGGVVGVLVPEVSGGAVAVAEVGDAAGWADVLDGGGGCGDEQVDGLAVVVAGESAGELLHGVWVEGEEPATGAAGGAVERGDARLECVDGGRDRAAGVEHGVEACDACAGAEEVLGDGVEDEFAAAACDEPVVCERDAEAGEVAGR